MLQEENHTVFAEVTTAVSVDGKQNAVIMGRHTLKTYFAVVSLRRLVFQLRAIQHGCNLSLEGFCRCMVWRQDMGIHSRTLSTTAWSLEH